MSNRPSFTAHNLMDRRVSAMKKLQDQLAEVSKALSGLFKKVNKLTRQARKMGPAARVKLKPGRKPGRKAPARAARVRQDTVLDSVYGAIKRSRKGKSFYGCDNYPKCNFAAWKKEDIK